MYVEFGSRNGGFLPTGYVQVVAGELEFPQFPLESFEIEAEIQECSQEHVAAQTTEDVQIEVAHENGRLLVGFLQELALPGQ
jgi:hypothetical protein